MGDEVATNGAIVFANGESVPLDGLRSVEFGNIYTADQYETWSGGFSMVAESLAGFDEAVSLTDQSVRSFVVEFENLITRSFPGASHFMRSRRMWQCGRGRRNANDERRKLSRKRRHVGYLRRRLVFPNCIIDRNVYTNEVEFTVWNGCEVHEEG